MAHGNARQSFPLFIVEPLRDGLGNPLVDFPGETRGPAAKQERPPGRERREDSRHREMPDRLTAGQHAERPRQGGDKHLECRYRGLDGKQADAEPPETRPRRPVRGVTPGSRRARVGLRTTHFEPGTLLPGHDADEIAPSPDKTLAGVKSGIPCARPKAGERLSQIKSVGRSRLKMRSAGSLPRSSRACRWPE